MIWPDIVSGVLVTSWRNVFLEYSVFDTNKNPVAEKVVWVNIFIYFAWHCELWGSVWEMFEGRAVCALMKTNSKLTSDRVTRSVTVSMSAFLAYHQCYCAGLSLAWGLNLWVVVCGIFWSSLPGVFSGYSGFLPSFIGLMVQPKKWSSN